MMLNPDQFKVLTFDCYGTLIDWETGILNALRPVLSQHGIEIDSESLLSLYGEVEAQLESGAYQPYRRILEGVLEQLGVRLQFHPTPDQIHAFPDSIAHWPPFADTVAALKALKRRYRLVILSNIDADLFALSARHLQVEFDAVITAQQAQSYKPAPRHFEVALETLGIPQTQILHVAQSLYHDIATARRLGFTTVWVNRRHHQPGSGATPLAEVTPDYEVPDLASLVSLLGVG